MRLEVQGAVIIAVSFSGAQLAPLEQHLPHRPIIFCQSCGNTAAGGAQLISGPLVAGGGNFTADPRLTAG